MENCFSFGDIFCISELLPLVTIWSRMECNLECTSVVVYNLECTLVVLFIIFFFKSIDFFVQDFIDNSSFLKSSPYIQFSESENFKPTYHNTHAHIVKIEVYRGHCIFQKCYFFSLQVPECVLLHEGCCKECDFTISKCDFFCTTNRNYWRYLCTWSTWVLYSLLAILQCIT